MANRHKVNAYLALAEKGVHLHVPALPGCFSRGQNEEQALQSLQVELKKYYADLARHGESAITPAHFEINIMERNNRATGPFDPGDTAALFEIEKTPIDSLEIQRYLSLATYNRADLLDLVGNMPGRLLDWQPPDSGSFSIRRILRHIGNADEWYVSCLISPEELPPEWETDAEMEIFDFLEMSRRTASEMFGRMNSARRSGEVVIPTHFTTAPSEPWTLRKALRRMLEHEREHTNHIREVIQACKDYLRQELIAAREDITAIVAQVPPAEVSTRLITGTWTLHEVVGHLVDWEILAIQSLRKALVGEETRKMDGFEEERVDEINAGFASARLAQPWGQVWAEYTAARDEMIALLDEVTGKDLSIKIIPPWDGELTVFSLFSGWPDHDREHLEMIFEQTGLSPKQ